MFCSVRWPLLRAEGFFCKSDILYRCLGIGKLQFLIQKKIKFFFSSNVFQFLAMKALDTDWIRIRIGSVSAFSLKCWILIRMKMNAEPQLHTWNDNTWFFTKISPS
jgi:hypothetical protein